MKNKLAQISVILLVLVLCGCGRPLTEDVSTGIKVGMRVTSKRMIHSRVNPHTDSGVITQLGYYRQCRLAFGSRKKLWVYVNWAESGESWIKTDEILLEGETEEVLE